MAISVTPISSELILVNDVDGTKTKKRSYKSIRSAATDDDVFSVAQSLVALQAPDNVAIQRRSVVELEDES